MPNFAWGYIGLADCYWLGPEPTPEPKQYARAVAIYQRALAVPELVERDAVCERLADLYEEQGDAEQAERHHDHTLRQHFQHDSRLVCMGGQSHPCQTPGSLDKFQRVQPRRLSDKAVARIVEYRPNAVGLDPDRYAGHSVRSGLATSAAAGVTSERAIMTQTAQRSTSMVSPLHLSLRAFRTSD